MKILMEGFGDARLNACIFLPLFMHFKRICPRQKLSDFFLRVKLFCMAYVEQLGEDNW